MKRLLTCPTCAESGNKEILGELDDNGNLIVMRFRGGGNNHVTKIISPLMAIQCGACSEIVFYRKKKK
jgi:hypothetical protein